MLTVLTNADFYVGDGVVADRALLVRDGVIDGWGSLEAKGDHVIDLEGQTVAPGFIDLQVNGGGDVLLNDEPTPSGVAAIAAGHRRVGTTDVMPTFITGPIEDMRRAAAGVAAARETGPGVLGIHFEGPMLSPAKLGVHDPRFVRGDDEDVLQVLIQAAQDAAVGKVIVTLAPEVVRAGTVSRLIEAGAIVAIGHTNATAEQVGRALDEGATLGTHVWNAMSPLGSREPGAVGALMSAKNAWCDFVADGHHVDFTTLRLSLRAAAPRAFLVTDAMSPVGGTKGGYRLGDLEVTVVDGRCVTADGTIAGSALDLATAVRNVVQHVGIAKDEALRMATAYPAQCLGVADRRGRIAQGYPAHLVVVDNELHVRRVLYGETWVATT